MTRGRPDGSAPIFYKRKGEYVMHRALYRTWRPRTFDEVCGQAQITDILKYQVSEGKTSHAYLFCGSRGTGKTTCAKILAKAVNCLHPVNGNPCNECEACRSIDAGTATDVIEMDAASNNGVDHVRDLKEEIVFMPAALKYRVYIIDEVHMMSPSAFNALLKTLEEPPSYVLFILATTELNKLPSTIISRCQRCDFRRIDTETIIGRLTHIAETEGMTLTRDGARMIARSAQGGMRDAVSLLELCGGAHAPIDEALVSELLGAGNRGTLYRTLAAVMKRDYPTVYTIVNDLVISSGDLAGFWSGLGDVLRDIIVTKTHPGAKEYLDLTDGEYEQLSEMGREVPLARLYYMSHMIDEILPALQKTGVSRRATLEVALTKMCDPRTSTTPEALAARVEELEQAIALLRVGGVTTAPQTATPDASARVAEPSPATPPRTEEAVRTVVKEQSTPPVTPPPTRQTAPVGGMLAEWKNIVREYTTLFPGYALLFGGSTAETEGSALIVTVANSFLVGSLERDPRATTALTNLASRMTGMTLTSVTFRKTGAGVSPATKTEENFF